jgi:cytochrome c
MTSIHRIARAFMLLTALVTGHAARAQSPAPDSRLALAQAKNCMSCHSVSRDSLGPPFRSIAAKYQAVEGARGLLARRIVEGSGDVWGVVPMPANTQVSPDQAETLVDWILSLR